MKIVQPSYKFETPIDGDYGKAMLRLIENAARTCYKSEGACTATSAGPFVKKIAQVKKHVSVIEHANVTVRFICDRGVTHELVRHRIAAYSQESTRYCNYSESGRHGGITLIHPPGLTPAQKQRREDHFWAVQALYEAELAEGLSPQIARGVLPNALKTEIVATFNLRQWRHVFTLRAAKEAHPQMQQLMRPLLAEFKLWLPELFDDIHPDIPPAVTVTTAE
jgi:thymidylate synthase (FAD)